MTTTSPQKPYLAEIFNARSKWARMPLKISWLIGANTEDAINSGIVYGHASMVDGLARRIEKQFGEKHCIVLTGGLSGLIAQYCECDIIVDRVLILKGLNYLYHSQKNQ